MNDHAYLLYKIEKTLNEKLRYRERDPSKHKNLEVAIVQLEPSDKLMNHLFLWKEAEKTKDKPFSWWTKLKNFIPELETFSYRQLTDDIECTSLFETSQKTAYATF